MSGLNDRSIKTASAILLLLAAVGGCTQRQQQQPPPPAPKILGTYARNCATPPPNWREAGNPPDRMWAVIKLDATGEITWNGTPTRDDILQGYIHQFEGPISELGFVAAPDAKCADVQKIRHMMSGLAMCRQQGRCVEGEKNLPPPVY